MIPNDLRLVNELRQANGLVNPVEPDRWSPTFSIGRRSIERLKTVHEADSRDVIDGNRLPAKVSFGVEDGSVGHRQFLNPTVTEIAEHKEGRQYKEDAHTDEEDLTMTREETNNAGDDE